MIRSTSRGDYTRFHSYGLTPEEWETICHRFDNRCASCRQVKPLTVDHIHPQSKGGTHDISNLQPLCRSCNSRKNARRIDFSESGVVMPPLTSDVSGLTRDGLVRVVFETTPELQHAIRLLAAKKNRKIRDVMEDIVRAALKSEGIEIAEVAK